jgi:hypothetical protein
MNRNGLALDDNFFSRQGQVDTNVERFAFLMMAVRNLNGYATPNDVVVESFEFLSLCANPVFYFGGMFHVAKRNLQWKRHCSLQAVNSLHKVQCHFFRSLSLLDCRLKSVLRSDSRHFWK